MSLWVLSDVLRGLLHSTRQKRHHFKPGYIVDFATERRSTCSSHNWHHSIKLQHYKL